MATPNPSVERPKATYQDVLDAPPHMVAEIINGTLHTHSRPAAPHARAASALGGKIGTPFDYDAGGPGGWWIIDEPELHLGEEILVPDLAGWRRERMTQFPTAAYFTGHAIDLSDARAQDRSMEPITETTAAKGHGARRRTGARHRGPPVRLSRSRHGRAAERLGRLPRGPTKTPRASRRAERALEAEDTLWENGNIERVWVHRARFDDGVPAGSLEAAIAREGRALAGDASMATKARTVPFEAETVLKNMNRATVHLRNAIAGAREQVQGPDAGQRAAAMVAMVTSSIAGAEALGRALCALTETEHTGDHRVGKSGRADRRPRRRAAPATGAHVDARHQRAGPGR